LRDVLYLAPLALLIGALFSFLYFLAFAVASLTWLSPLDLSGFD